MVQLFEISPGQDFPEASLEYAVDCLKRQLPCKFQGCANDNHSQKRLSTADLI